MKIPFLKYQGTGNDFVIIDNREGLFNSILQKENINHICHRKRGIGADGLILLENDLVSDFKMTYYNADGKESSMCGNGGRCIAAFAAKLGIYDRQSQFKAIDGMHEVEITQEDLAKGYCQIKLKMQDVNDVIEIDDSLFINTGSPHYIVFEENVQNIDVDEKGKKIRYSERFAQEGTNVNFINRYQDGIYVRTYERGVEAETLSCGTGATASALAAAYKGWIAPSGNCKVYTPGGLLHIFFVSTHSKKLYSIESKWYRNYSKKKSRKGNRIQKDTEYFYENTIKYISP